MKKSTAIDRQCIAKILKYIGEIKEILERDGIASFQDLQDSLSTKYAITQIITNVYELSRKLQESALEKLKNFNTPTLRKARQIASHEYDAVDFMVIYNLCINLTDSAVVCELTSLMEALKND